MFHALDAARLRVLYEDNHLIGVYKPAGVLTQGDRGGEPSLLDWVKAWIAERHRKPGQVFLGMVHRLDRPVSGVVLFAKTSKAASRLSEQFRARDVDKRYLARIEGVIEPARGRLAHFIAHTEGVRRVQVFAEARAGAKAASLTYETERRERGECVVAVQLESGRKHQIRGQLAHVGHPIVGDTLYGARRKLPGDHDQIALCAQRLEVTHPTTRARVTLELPADLMPRSVTGDS